jgi:hypothetical protein
MKLIMDDGREYDIARVARSEMNPGDVLVVSCKNALDPGAADDLHAVIDPLFPEMQVLLITGEIGLSTISRSKA